MLEVMQCTNALVQMKLSKCKHVKVFLFPGGNVLTQHDTVIEGTLNVMQETPITELPGMLM